MKDFTVLLCMSRPFVSLSFLLALLLASLSLWPSVDLTISGLFAQGSEGFFFGDSALLKGLSKAVFYVSRVMAVFLLVGFAWAFVRKDKWLGLGKKAWLFLLLALLVGPGLFANLVFKDHWGRARPSQVVDFGGTKTFTPAWYLSEACDKNCSFVSGDASFGFFLPCFAYVVSTRIRRRVFVGTLVLGSVIALSRLVMGAHFISDVVYAAILSLGVGAGLHALMYGAQQTLMLWRSGFRNEGKVQDGLV